MKGAELIAIERARQVAVEKYDPAHDDDHQENELLAAAACYSSWAALQTRPQHHVDRSQYVHIVRMWPWDVDQFKAMRADPIRNLVKAGALIAAEIDRLQRLKDKPHV